MNLLHSLKTFGSAIIYMYFLDLLTYDIPFLKINSVVLYKIK